MINFQFVQIGRKDNVKCGFFIDYLSNFINNMTKCTILQVNNRILTERWQENGQNRFRL